MLKRLVKNIWVRRLIRTFIALSLLIVASGMGFYYSVKWGFFGEIPGKEELQKIQNAQASEIYSSDGVLLGRYFHENRTSVKFEDISPLLCEALIATEDERFYEHKGVDQRSMMRVLIKTIILGDRSSGGGSTISQQLIKNLLGRQDHGKLTMPVNKTKEALLAQTLEETYSKSDILEMYLNTVSFGENVYGIQRACERYFSSNVTDIKLTEAASLIGMLKAPTTYNPRSQPENAMRRRNTVLNQMLKNEYITQAQYDSASVLPLGVAYHKYTRNQGSATYFREFVRVQVQNWLKGKTKADGSEYDLYVDGLVITTTIDSRLQAIAEKAVRSHLESLQETFWKHLKNDAPWGKNTSVYERALKTSRRYIKLAGKGVAKDLIDKEFDTPIKMLVYDVSGSYDTLMSPKDSITHYLGQLHAGFLALEPQTGAVKAWVGGINHEFFEYDHIHAKRQVGSTFKPIVYAAALKKHVRPCKFISNKREVYEEYEDWSPRNSNGDYEGAYSMKGALTHSVNTITVKLLFKAGLDRVINLAKNMGIESELPLAPSIALGTANISLIEMVGAYTAFPNKGEYSKPHYIESIKDQKGSIMYEAAVYNKAVMSKDQAAVMCNLMSSVVDNGTGLSIRSKYKIEATCGGKTGTTQSQADGWFIGYTPSLVAGAWVGADDPGVHFKSTRLGQGATMALPIWASFIKEIEDSPELNSWTAGQFETVSPSYVYKLDCELKRDLVLNMPKLFKKKKGTRSKKKGKRKLFGKK